MDDARERLAKLSPEKRRLLLKLATQKQNAAEPQGMPANAAAAVIDEERFRFDTEGSLKEKSEVQAFYDAVNSQLNVSEFGEFSLFLNYGYIPNDAKTYSKIPVPNGTLSKNAVRLVLELVGDAPLTKAQKLLDVGCGRGGTISIIRRFFNVGEVTGIDLSPVAIQLCKKVHTFPQTHFIQGDAEHLPFDNGAFDVVTNVESSHAYPNPNTFFEEVSRVVTDRGVFLYTDLIPANIERRREQFLAQLGLHLEHRRDITSNVVMSCDETAEAHGRAFSTENSRAMMGRFLGVRGSELYDAMKDGSQKYLLYRFRKGNPK